MLVTSFLVFVYMKRHVDFSKVIYTGKIHHVKVHFRRVKEVLETSYYEKEMLDLTTLRTTKHVCSVSRMMLF